MPNITSNEHVLNGDSQLSANGDSTIKPPVVSNGKAVNGDQKPASNGEVTAKAGGGSVLKADKEADLLWACASGDLTAARKILDDSETPPTAASMAKDCLDLCSVHFACASGNIELVRYLCEPPHNVNPTAIALSAQDSSPVVIAARYGHLEIVQYLVERHAALISSGAPRGWEEWDKLLAIPDLLATVDGQGPGEKDQPFKPLFPLVAMGAEMRQPPVSTLATPDRIVANLKRVRHYIRSCLPESSAPHHSMRGSDVSSSAGTHRFHRGDGCSSSGTWMARKSTYSSQSRDRKKDFTSSCSSGGSRSSSASCLRERRGLQGLAVATADAKGERRSTSKSVSEEGDALRPRSRAVVKIAETKPAEDDSAKAQRRLKKGGCCGVFFGKKKS